ncbi:MAG: Protein-methionine-sulfoxide reductase catalytic subunit MsrP [Verrucomicrobiales bacterium]|nr:Protein-methionine-sulfoxide reductase catalytic subunit MsrP [Verrucomicrobiales bacterium]
MPNIIVRPDWQLSEKDITPESIYQNRRLFLKQLGFSGAALIGGSATGCGKEPEAKVAPSVAASKEAANPNSGRKYPARRNPEFNPKLPLTDAEVAGSYNNFYEFTLVKEAVKNKVGKFIISPWSIQVGGLVEKPVTLDFAELEDSMPLEERIYRFRCVEAWSMVVPWTGFPLSTLIDKLKPKSDAKFIRFETFNKPDQAPGMASSNYPWPYFEGLRMNEAMNPLTMVVTGIYGKPLPKQHGAPLRIIVPWKYGYKSIKSIVKIDFIANQPKTFWETLASDEYPFESNVNPAVSHPRWSQATEKVIDTGDRVRTQLYNGYGSYVAKLYPKV